MYHQKAFYAVQATTGLMTLILFMMRMKKSSNINKSMTMKKIFLSVLATAAVLAACTNEIEPQINPGSTSDFLVISADCLSMTKTDMNEGQSTWEAGDKITVVYEGAAYEYVASAAGETTTFTSTAGIVNYDASKPITAYYPVTDAAGTVKIEAEKTVAFNGTEQVNSSCAPLVGTPKSDNLAGGVLSMVFQNVFSVIELRIDAGQLAGTVKSVTLSPASAEGFSGYLSVAGTVNPETLAVTAASTGNSIKVNLPANADPKKALTLKVPVGRFVANDGLKVTYETSEGSFERVVYKSGIASYEEKDGKFSVKHFAKPMYAFEASAGGISTAADFVAFAAAVNAGESIAKWMNSEGKVVLNNDIDMASVTEWTPIGAGVYTWASNKLTCNSGNPFVGYFDGQGKTIRNFNPVCTNSTAGGVYGLFGCLGAGAVVENIVFDSTCSMELKSTKATDCGMLAGLAWDATIKNITNKGTLKYTGTSDSKKTTLAVVGMAFAQTQDVLIENVVNEGNATAVSGGTNQNGGNAVQVAGILGFGTNHVDVSKIVHVKDCINRGNLESATARTSGLVAACNRYTVIRGCANYGHNLNTFNEKTESAGSAARIGNITCITGAGSAIYDTVNYGDVISTTKGAIAGILCLVNAADNVLNNVANYGRIITDRPAKSYCGAFFGQCNIGATITNCICGGAFGTYNGGNYQITELTAENYWDYVGQIGEKGVNATKDNIKFGTRPN